MLGSGGPSTRAPIGASRVLMDHGLDGAAPPCAAVPGVEVAPHADDVFRTGALKGDQTDSWQLLGARSRPTAVEVLAPICSSSPNT